jgi:hypothetical protein
MCVVTGGSLFHPLYNLAAPEVPRFAGKRGKSELWDYLLNDML